MGLVDESVEAFLSAIECQQFSFVRPIKHVMNWIEVEFKNQLKYSLRTNIFEKGMIGGLSNIWEIYTFINVFTILLIIISLRRISFSWPPTPSALSIGWM